MELIEPKTKKPHVRHNLHGLVVKFNEVPVAGLDYSFSHTKGELNLSLFDIMGDYPVYHVNLRVEPFESMVQVKGDFTCELRLTCSRCAEEFSQNFKKNFVTAFYKSENSLKNFGVDASNLDSSFDLELLEGEEIDLAEVVHEQIALEVPFKPLCEEECKGLCVSCGTNLNMSSCQCVEIVEQVPISIISPFEKLKLLRGE